MGKTVIVTGPTSQNVFDTTALWVQHETVLLAEKSVQEEVAKGFDNRPTVVTDGKVRRDYRLVKPFGKVEFVARSNMYDVVRFAFERLVRRSPVLTGRYILAHSVLVNGREIDALSELKNLQPMDRVTIINPQPYARKLEGATANKKTGRGKRKPSSRQAPQGVYRVVQREVVAKYGKSIFVDFKYIPLPQLGVKVWGDSGGRYRKSAVMRALRGSRTRVVRIQRNQVYPALQFFIKSTDDFLN